MCRDDYGRCQRTSQIDVPLLDPVDHLAKIDRRLAAAAFGRRSPPGGVDQPCSGSEASRSSASP